MVLLLFIAVLLLTIGLRLVLLNDVQHQVPSLASQQAHIVTIDDLFNVEEVKLTAMSAYKYDDHAELIPLQARLLDTAKQLNMSQVDIELINSPRFFTYLRFKAAREWFDLDMQNAFQNLEDLAPIKDKYPEAKDLFVSAEALFLKRDYILQEIAAEIATQQQQTTNESHMEAAKARWLARTNKNNLNQNP